MMAKTSTMDNIFLSRARLALSFLLAPPLCLLPGEEGEGGVLGQVQWYRIASWEQVWSRELII